MITDGKKWHYLAVKSLPALLRGKKSNHNGDFHCLNCFHSNLTDNKLTKHENVCNKHDYCYTEMPTEDNEILEYNHGEKSLKVPFIIFFDLESLLPKMRSCQNNPERPYTERKAKHIPSGSVWYLTCSFDSTKKKHGYFRGRDCIERATFKELTVEIINYEEKEVIPLTDEEKEFYEKQKLCHICKKKFCFDENEKSEFKLYHKVRDHCHYTEKFR